jgi:hypothetical protein
MGGHKCGFATFGSRNSHGLASQTAATGKIDARN